eukprot:5538813-Pyramimonas_sp.AAC.1
MQVLLLRYQFVDDLVFFFKRLLQLEHQVLLFLAQPFPALVLLLQPLDLPLFVLSECVALPAPAKHLSSLDIESIIRFSSKCMLLSVRESEKPAFRKGASVGAWNLAVVTNWQIIDILHCGNVTMLGPQAC